MSSKLINDIFSYQADHFANAVPSAYFLPLVVLLLIVSNIFMSFAWYHHLKSPGMPFILALSISLIYVIFEYAANIHANAIGYKKLDIYTLKILQEAITLLVFMGFAFVVFKKTPTWKHLTSFGLILGATALAT